MPAPLIRLLLPGLLALFLAACALVEPESPESAPVAAPAPACPAPSATLAAPPVAETLARKP
ncbi:MAG TPA: peptidoglycan-associated lipoprotein, partial [Desulfovibrio sp.]|nr:peptidoglycan-associated lipoprotein [Desulfovibrio sp.]